MNKDFDFNKVGKRMPYQVPDNFFDKLEANVMAEVKADIAEAKQKRKRRIVTWGTTAFASAAAAVALLVTVNLKAPSPDKYSSEAVTVAFSQLQPSDQAYLLEVYNEDVFINGQY